MLRGGVQSDNVVSFDFTERSEDNIFSKLPEMMDTADDLERVLTKKNVPLFDLFFITSDLSQRDPEDIFFSFYNTLHASRYHFTITEIEYPKYREQYCYIMEDVYGTKYRLHIQSETQHLEYDHGILVADVKDFRNGLSGDISLVPLSVSPSSPVLVHLNEYGFFGAGWPPKSIVKVNVISSFGE